MLFHLYPPLPDKAKGGMEIEVPNFLRGEYRERGQCAETERVWKRQ